MLIRVGSRGSRLALTQAERAASRLRAPGIEIALVPITTAGDRDRSKPFGEIGSRGVFVKELEEALLEHRIDVAVHSAKDMTSTDRDGLCVGAYLLREDPRDALCGADGIRPGMRVGTASARRKAQLLALEPSLSIEPLRGNIDTRLRKRGERGLDAIVLAACGLDRLGLAHEAGYRFEPDELLPEAGQGALALQVRSGDGASRRRCRRRGDAPPRRGRARGRRRGRRRLPRSGGGVSRRHDPDGPHRRRGWVVARAPHRGRSRRTRTGAARMRVIVTRDELVPRLEALGHDVVVCELIRTEPLGDDPIDAGAYDWLIVTSPNGAHEVGRRLGEAPLHFAAIGPGTAEVLRRYGYEPDLVPRVHTQEGLRDELPPGRRLLAAAEGARRDVLDADFLPLYRTVELSPPPPEGDIAVLMSGSAARALAATGARMPVVAIGPQTAAQARALGLEVVAVAMDHDIDGLVEAVSSL